MSLTNIEGNRVRSRAGLLEIDGHCQFSVATPIATSTVADALRPGFNLLGLDVQVSDYEVLLTPAPTEWWLATPASPVLTKKDERWTDPAEDVEACVSALRRNLLGRWERLCAIPELESILAAWTGEVKPTEEWAKEHLPIFEFPSPTATHMRTMKNGSARCWSGVFRVVGHPAWTQVLWHTGIGPKPLFGFGLVWPMAQQKRT
jgi:hypothetical protein